MMYPYFTLTDEEIEGCKGLLKNNVHSIINLSKKGCKV